MQARPVPYRAERCWALWAGSSRIRRVPRFPTRWSGIGAQAAVRVEHRAVCLFQLQGRPCISPLPRCCKWAWRRRRWTSRPLACCWDSIWWRGSWRALEDASQDSSSETQQTQVSYQQGNNLQYWHVTTVHRKTMSRVSVSKSGISPLVRNASLERHTQRFLELNETGAGRVFLQRYSTEANDEVRQSPVRLCLRRHQAPRPYFELTYKANGKTVNVKLSPEAAPLYRAAARQYRKLKTLLNRLDKLSKTILRHQAELAESKRQN